MIDVQRARKLIEENRLERIEETVFVSSSLGCVLSADIQAPVSLPVFDNSAMDGFALRSKDTVTASPKHPVRLAVEGLVKAGDCAPAPLEKMRASRIMTGAIIPHGADTVLAKEQANATEGFLTVQEPLEAGKNIRWCGEEIKKGKTVLSRGTMIHAGTIGFLSSLGIQQIRIYAKPKIALIASGSELVAPGLPLTRGKIYDSNTPMIKAALDQMRIRPELVRQVSDQPKTIQKVIDFSLKESHFLIVMGGVSVGDFDWVKQALETAGVEKIFWQVSQKPGKPLYFGKKGNCLVFGLPGNPAAVFTCFYEYVYPAIRRFMGYENPCLASTQLPLSESIQPDKDKTLFMKAKTSARTARERHASLLKHQKSHMLSSLCEADSFVVLPASEKAHPAGEEVEVHALPYAVGEVA